MSVKGVDVSIPLFRGIQILKSFLVADRPLINTQSGYRIPDASHAAIQHHCERNQAAPPVDSAQRLQSAVGAGGNQAVEVGIQLNGLLAKQANQVCLNVPQVAGQNQIPFAIGECERSFHSRQRSASLPKVRNDHVSQPPVSRRFTDNHGAARSFRYAIGHVLEKCFLSHREQSFVLSHPRASAAGQHKAGHTRAGRLHQQMIPSRGLRLSPASANLALFFLGFSFAGSLAMAGGEPTRATLVVKSDLHTGRLVRSVVVEPRPVPLTPAESAVSPASELEPPDNSLVQMINRIAALHDVEPMLVHSVIKAESNYNPLAISSKGAQGIMQLIPATARRFGVANTFNVQQNIEGGVKYLKFLMDYFHSDYVKVIAAYNAGEAAVDKYGGIPPYSETRNYVNIVGRNLVNARKEAEKKASLAIPAQPLENTHTIQSVISSDGRVYYRSQ
jgi:hypothetical protein